jgi:hypothetical protein
VKAAADAYNLRVQNSQRNPVVNRKEEIESSEKEAEKEPEWVNDDWDEVIRQHGEKFQLPILPMTLSSTTVFDIVDEWIEGTPGGMPPIEYLEHKFIDQSWLKSERGQLRNFFLREAILIEIESLEDDDGLEPKEAMA